MRGNMGRLKEGKMEVIGKKKLKNENVVILL